MRSIFCLASATASSFFAARLLSGERARMGRSARVRVDADAPLRPLPHRHDVVAAISPGFRCRHLGPHAMAPRRVSIAEANSGGRNKKNLIAAVVSSASDVARHPVGIVGLAVASIALLLMLFRLGLDVTMIISPCPRECIPVVGRSCSRDC